MGRIQSRWRVLALGNQADHSVCGGLFGGFERCALADGHAFHEMGRWGQEMVVFIFTSGKMLRDNI